MQLSKPQQLIANDESRFKVVVAGRRFGKTYLAMRQLAYNGRIPDREIFYITSSYRAAKMILWKPLKHRMLDLNWAEKINESELSILLKNGTTISLKGSENKDSLRGVSLDYCVIDEVASCDPDLFPEIIRPALADKQGEALFIGTPAGKGNYFFDLYNNASTLKGWKSWQFTTVQGGQVTEEEVEAARADMSERQFRQEFMATFETYENRVAWSFERDNNVKPAPQDISTKLLEVGMDFNRSPLVATIGVKTSPDTLHIIDEIQIYGSNTDEMVYEINQRYPNSRINVYPDPSGSRQQTSSKGKSDHIILENAGFRVLAPRKHDPVKDRINAANARLCNANGENFIYIDPKCKHLIDSLEKFTYKEGTQVPDKGQHDHFFDAFSYCVAYMWPIRKPQKPTTPQRWGVAMA